MANLNKPFGLAPSRNLAGGKWNEQATRYYIPSTDTLAYYVGDTVLQAADGDAKGVSAVIKASLGTETLRGVIVGVEVAAPQPVSLAGTTLDLTATNIPATKTRPYYAYVVDDPMCLFTVQGDGTATNQVASKSSNNSSLTVTAGAVAAPSPSYSQTVLNTSTFATTSTLSIKLIGLQPIPNNTYGSYSVYRAKINEHDFQGNMPGV